MSVPQSTDRHCAHGFYFPGGCLYCANAEIERLDARVKWLEQYNAATEDTLTREKSKRQQAEHERDCAVEDVARLERENARLKRYLLGVPELRTDDVPPTQESK